VAQKIEAKNALENYCYNVRDAAEGLEPGEENMCTTARTSANHVAEGLEPGEEKVGISRCSGPQPIGISNPRQFQIPDCTIEFHSCQNFLKTASHCENKKYNITTKNITLQKI
jgi:hypothetical protein